MRFSTGTVVYRAAAKPKSDLYRDTLAHLNGAAVELLDHPALIAQLWALERRTSRGGRDSIDHGPHGHDGVANAVCGVVQDLLVRQPGSAGGMVPLYGSAYSPEPCPFHFRRSRYFGGLAAAVGLLSVVGL